MSGDIDRELAKITAARRRQAAWQTWARRYDGGIFRAVREEALRPANSPHHDLLVDFSTRAIAAGMGEERFVLTGPDGQLYSAQPCTFHRDALKRQKWTARREIRRCNARIVAEGRRAVQLRLYGDAWSTPRVDVEWLVLGKKYFVYSRSKAEWHTRDGFLHECASALSTTRPRGR